MNRASRLVGIAALWLGVLLAGLVCLLVRLTLEGERELARSDAEFDRGRLRESLQFATRSAALYAPGLAHVARADARLDAIAMGAESSQRQDLAMLAWQAIRSTEVQRHWRLGRPTDRAKRAERRLAAHLADDGRQGSLVDQERYARRVLADLEGNKPKAPWRSIALIAALGAIAAGFVALHVGLGKGDRQRAWLWAAGCLSGVGAVGWAILLLFA